VPITVGPRTLYVDLRDAMAHDLFRDGPYGEDLWEADEQSVLRRVIRSGDIVFDVGAHLGEHAVLFSDLVGRGGRVYAFEANPERILQLRRTLHALGNATVFPCALSDRVATATLFVPELHACASLSDWTNGRSGPTRRLSCDVRRLDDLVAEERLPPPDFVKCDVEGAELLVFRGASGLLNSERAPVILFERNRKATNAFGIDVRAPSGYLLQLPDPGYELFTIDPGGELSPTAPDAPYEKVSNLLAVPRARRDRVLRPMWAG
jgi:FkbM family methyltransferase